METISLTVPHKVGPLNRAAQMLTQLAADCVEVSPHTVEEAETPVLGVPGEVETPVVTKVATVPVYTMPETGAADVTKPPVDEGSGLEGEGLDSEGLPWDGRIHASSKTVLAKTQAWKLKRGVAPAFVEQVKAELRAAQGTAPVVTEPAVTPVVTEVPPVVTEVPPAATFETICAKVTARANAQLLLTTDIPEVLAPHGLTHIGELAARPDLFVAIDAALDTLWATTPV